MRWTGSTSDLPWAVGQIAVPTFGEPLDLVDAIQSRDLSSRSSRPSEDERSL